MWLSENDVVPADLPILPSTARYLTQRDRTGLGSFIFSTTTNYENNNEKRTKKSKLRKCYSTSAVPHPSKMNNTLTFIDEPTFI